MFELDFYTVLVSQRWAVTEGKAWGAQKMNVYISRPTEKWVFEMMVF